MTRRIESLSSTRALVSGVLWNGVGRGLPILIALATTPFLLHHLGVDRWALYTLALSVAGSFGVLDFGIGAALTRALAERIGTDEEKDAAPLIVAATAGLTVLGVAGSIIGAALSPVLVDDLLTVPAGLRSEAISSLCLLALSVPLIVVNAALWGVIAAYQKFRAATIINIPVNAAYYVGPVIALSLHDSLMSVIATLVLARLLQTCFSTVLTLRLVPALLHVRRIELYRLRSLLRIGLWVTVSNTLWPVMLHVDRFIVGAVLTLASVSYFTTPLDLVLRLLMVPMSVAACLFPAVATSYRTLPHRACSLLGTGSAVSIALVFPLCAVFAGFADVLLSVWLGPGFAGQSQTVLTIMSVGMFLNCAALLPTTFTDAIGRPEIGGVTILIQLILFPPLVYWMTVRYGIEGAALAWTIRATANCAVRFLVCLRLGARAAPLVPGLTAITCLGAVALVLCALIGSTYMRIAVTAIACAAVPLAAALVLLDEDTQASLRRLVLAYSPRARAARRFKRI